MAKIILYLDKLEKLKPIIIFFITSNFQIHLLKFIFLSVAIEMENDLNFLSKYNNSITIV